MIHSTALSSIHAPHLSRDTAPNIDPDEPLMDPADVAAALGISQSFVYKILRRGLIPSLRIGRRYKVTRASFLAFELMCADPVKRAEIAHLLRNSHLEPPRLPPDPLPPLSDLLDQRELDSNG